MMQMLRADAGFAPYPVRDGDELFPNGIFEFNITRILAYLESNPTDVDLVEIAVRDFHPEFSSVDESHVETVDTSRPVVLAEISPGHYNLIDGHHRMEKARQVGVDTMQAYKLAARQHITFLTSKKAYLSYVEYWNEKVRTSGSKERPNKSVAQRRGKPRA